MSSFIPRSDEETRRITWSALEQVFSDIKEGKVFITMEEFMTAEANPLLAYHRHLREIADTDIEYVKRKDAQYSASWKKRDGAGAFFTFARPWDRLESIARSGAAQGAPALFSAYDIFAIIAAEGLQGPDGSLIACVRDLRRYLLLLEAEVTERKLAADAAHNATDPSPGLVAFGRAGDAVQANFEELERRVLAQMGVAEDPQPRTPEQKARDFAEAYGPGTPDDGGHHERGTMSGGHPPDFVDVGPVDTIPLETVRGVERMVPRRPVLAGETAPQTSHPWVVGMGYLTQLGNPMLWDAWKRVTNSVYVLEQRLDPATWYALPEDVQECYSPVYSHPRRTGDDVIPSWSDDRPLHPDADVLIEPVAYWLRVDRVPDDERPRWTTYSEEQNMKEAESLMEAIELYEWVSSKFRYILRDKRRAWLPQ